MPSFAMASFYTGNDLWQFINADKSDFVDLSVGQGYIAGVVDESDHKYFCVPDGVNAGQIRDMIKKYLENNPAIRHLPANQLITIGLKKVWPCHKRWWQWQWLFLLGGFFDGRFFG
ncbi:MAG: Rap1a/Tai family immunity protein [Hydrotalea sp.]|nr:Rap1a/Tai family immunity protein [Hydrotalea sp.]